MNRILYCNSDIQPQQNLFYLPLTLNFPTMINNILYLALSSFVAFSSGELFEYTEFQSSDAGKDISFGSSASISNDYFSVGSYKESNCGINAGASYIFQKDNSIGWNHIKKIQALDKKA
eukprot:459667_1